MKPTRSLFRVLFLALGYWSVIQSSAGIGFSVISSNALSFDGTNGSVEIGAADLPPPWTATMWVRRENALTPSSALLISSAGALKLEQWEGTRQVGFTHFGVADYNFGYIAPEGVWTHLAFVATPGETTLYANGVAVSSVAASISLPLQSLASPTRDPLKGQVDELAVWRVARTAAQIRANYKLRAKGNEPGLELLWHCDENSGATTADATSHHHVGELSNGVSRVLSGAFIGQPLTVSNANDSGAGSLRAAVADFANVGVIRFAPGLSGKTIKLTSGPIAVNRNVIIDGSTLRKPPTISGNNTSRIFTVSGFTSSMFYKLKIVNGRAATDGGGGIFNLGDLALSDCVFSNNAALGAQLSAGGLLAPGQSIVGVAAVPGSSVSSIAAVGTVAGVNNYPAVESPGNAIDANTNTKYLNFYEINTGFIVTIPGNLTTVAGFQFTTANDAPERDPFAVSIEGTSSADPTTAAAGATWAPLYSGVAGLVTDPGRQAQGAAVSFANSSLFNTYRVLITGVRDTAPANSMQFSEIQFFGLTALAGGAIFNQGDGTMTIENCTFSRNRADFGGAIQNQGELVANNSTFSGNMANVEGGALSGPVNEAAFFRCFFVGNVAGKGGAIFTGAELLLEHCSFFDNRTSDAPIGQAAGHGGAIHIRSSSEVEIEQCVFFNNSTGRGGAGGSGYSAGWGGAIFNGGETTIHNSTFSGNHTGAGGQGNGDGGYGGDGGDGGAIRNEDEMTVINSTFTGNFTGDGGYAGDGGAISIGGGSTVLTHTTISGNRTGVGPFGGNGGGVWTGGPLTLNSCAVAGNTAQASEDITPGYTANQSFVGGDPMLNPLGFYGGPTATMLPLPESPLVDAGGDTGQGEDQRGFPRPIGPAREIGSVEVQDNPDSMAPIIIVGPQGGTAAAGSTVTLRVGFVGSRPYTFQWQFNGRSISGGTNASLVLTNVQRVNGGSYKVRVSNPFGSATSGPTRLKVVQPITITSHPTNVAAMLGDRVTLRVTATGGTPLKYQWRRNGIDIPGATRSSYTIPSFNAANVGDYTVRVSNPVGAQLSNVARVDFPF